MISQLLAPTPKIKSPIKLDMFLDKKTQILFFYFTWKVAPIVAWMVAHKSRDTSTVAWVTQILAWDAFKSSQLISIRGWAVIKLAQAAWKLSQATLKAAWDAFFLKCILTSAGWSQGKNKSI